MRIEIENPIYDSDQYLKNFKSDFDRRHQKMTETINEIDQTEGIDFFTQSYTSFGLHVMEDNSIQGMEWAPEAEAVCLRGDFNQWKRLEYNYEKLDFGKWRISIPPNKDGSCRIPLDSKLKLTILNVNSGKLIDRISPWARYVKQPPKQPVYDWHFYNKRVVAAYKAKFDRPKKPEALRIYEAHIGICSPKEGVSTYVDFTNDVLPRVHKNGYNVIQLMAIQEHAYYASFGYQVTSFFASSSRFGTPEELKELIDCAHGLGIIVLLDLVHSHASSNVMDGLNQFDGSDSCFFHGGSRGNHAAWGSRLFNYGHWEVLRFLLSNCRFWIEEFGFDGFRFDGVTSMLYHHHGIDVGFSGDYSEYFGLQCDEQAINYLKIANYFLHSKYPFMITIAEEVSGMPGTCISISEAGLGFDYRLGMSIPDMWIKLLKETRDEDWDIGNIVHILENRRDKEKVIAYAESHDQALVGDKTLAFWMMDFQMYTHMSKMTSRTNIIDRGIALHKMIRLLVHTMGGEGYLNFIGNEFGHPEWLDFPRKGNSESYQHCRRQFNLVDDENLRYQFLNNFDAKMNKIEQEVGWLSSEKAFVTRKHLDDKVIIFDRANCVFAFNFHHAKSYNNYRVGVREPGKYQMILNSDSSSFDGHARLSEDQTYFSSPISVDGLDHSVIIYLPSRTSFVLKRILEN